MTFNTIPHTEIKVSNICLGTMTFGKQDTIQDANNQINLALENGINFIDTAEMYAIPASAQTYGITEEFIGEWIQKSARRHDIVLATKIAGDNRGMDYIRDDMRYNDATIRLSVEKSLRRLRTDYIDLYQLHWPERKTNMFGQLSYIDENDDWKDNIFEVLQTVQSLITEGKIRCFGLSNETPWGITRFLNESEKHNLPKVVTLQNPYSLVNRSLEVGISEICQRDHVGILAYSPLAFGQLTGKFLNNQQPPNARLTMFPQFLRYNTAQCLEAVAKYNSIAQNHNITLTQLSLAFLKQQKIVASTIIGATTLSQLQENIDAFKTILSQEILDEINLVQKQFPNPAP